MRAVIKRVLSASVTVEGDVVSAVPRPGGLLVLVGVREGDTRDDLEWMSNEILRARLFPSAGDGEGGAGKPWDANVMQGGKEAGLPRCPCPIPAQSAILATVAAVITSVAAVDLSLKPLKLSPLGLVGTVLKRS